MCNTQEYHIKGWNSVFTILTHPCLSHRSQFTPLRSTEINYVIFRRYRNIVVVVVVHHGIIVAVAMVELGNKKYPPTPLEVHNIIIPNGTLGAGTASKLSASALVYRRNCRLRCYGLFHSFAPLCKQQASCLPRLTAISLARLICDPIAALTGMMESITRLDIARHHRPFDDPAAIAPPECWDTVSSPPHRRVIHWHMMSSLSSSWFNLLHG